jgi:hypothetical protein
VEGKETRVLIAWGISCEHFWIIFSSMTLTLMSSTPLSLLFVTCCDSLKVEIAIRKMFESHAMALASWQFAGRLFNDDSFNRKLNKLIVIVRLFSSNYFWMRVNYFAAGFIENHCDVAADDADYLDVYRFLVYRWIDKDASLRYF